METLVLVPATVAKNQPSSEHEARPRWQLCTRGKETYDCARKKEEQLDIKSESDKLSNQL